MIKRHAPRDTSPKVHMPGDCHAITARSVPMTPPRIMASTNFANSTMVGSAKRDALMNQVYPIFIDRKAAVLRGVHPPLDQALRRILSVDGECSLVCIRRFSAPKSDASPSR